MSDLIVVQTWLQKHERLLIVAMVLLVGGWVADRIVTHLDNTAQIKQSVTEEALTKQKTANDDLAKQNTALAQSYQADLNQVQAQLVAVKTAASVRQTALVKQQTIDQTAPGTVLQARWQALVGDKASINASDTITTVPTGYLVTPNVAQATVSTLEQIPALQESLTDTEKEYKDEVSLNLAANHVIDADATQIKGLNLQIVDEEKACTAKVDAVNAAARKGKLKWFGIGYVAGFISGLILK